MGRRGFLSRHMAHVCPWEIWGWFLAREAPWDRRKFGILFAIAALSRNFLRLHQSRECGFEFNNPIFTSSAEPYSIVPPFSGNITT